MAPRVPHIHYDSSSSIEKRGIVEVLLFYSKLFLDVLVDQMSSIDFFMLFFLLGIS